ncbi:MAG: 16S rRNA (cytosine(1402)-N(4))-methyltransferase [Rhodospirillaceae bacterium]|nr:16S rRNA (cytosine(1402)-N(4))-methyltransferase [Rhodospirillaceae bacterium]
MTLKVGAPTNSEPTDGHAPVMIDEVVAALQPRDGGRYVDGTFGAGGYTAAILDAADCRVWAIDRDTYAIAAAAKMVDKYAGRLTVVEGRFGDMVEILSGEGIEVVDGIALDLGVSSMQIDDPNRGFSFRHDGPLDMRQGNDSLSASDLINGADEGVLADIIFNYGEERQARRIARAIVNARADAPITRTGQLADIVRNTYRGGSSSKIDPATKTFQAIRIQVNEELDELKSGLRGAEIMLAPSGRLAVVSFHSLEDRIVKEFLRTHSGEISRASRHLPAAIKIGPAPCFSLVRRGAQKPSAKETTRNPRSRSARLRVAERTCAPPMGET